MWSVVSLHTAAVVADVEATGGVVTISVPPPVPAPMDESCQDFGIVLTDASAAASSTVEEATSVVDSCDCCW